MHSGWAKSSVSERRPDSALPWQGDSQGLQTPSLIRDQAAVSSTARVPRAAPWDGDGQGVMASGVCIAACSSQVLQPPSRVSSYNCSNSWVLSTSIGQNCASCPRKESISLSAVLKRAGSGGLSRGGEASKAVGPGQSLGLSFSGRGRGGVGRSPGTEAQGWTSVGRRPGPGV